MVVEGVLAQAEEVYAHLVGEHAFRHHIAQHLGVGDVCTGHVAEVCRPS